MIENLGVTAVSSAAVIPIILAVVQAIKLIIPGDRIHKWAPIISIGAGIAISTMFNLNHMRMGDAILSGVVYGLSASGLYSGTKSVSHAVKGEENSGGTGI